MNSAFSRERLEIVSFRAPEGNVALDRKHGGRCCATDVFRAAVRQK